MLSVVTLVDLSLAHVKLDILEMAKLAGVYCFVLFVFLFFSCSFFLFVCFFFSVSFSVVVSVFFFTQNSILLFTVNSSKSALVPVSDT